MGERLDHSPAPDAGDLRRVAFEEAAVGLAVLSADARLILDANRAFCDLVGLAPDGLTARPIADLLGPGGVLAEGVQVWRRGDGGPVDVRVRRSGTAGTVLVVEAVDADEAARSAENRDALVAAGLGEWRWDALSGRLTLSRRAAQILGHPPGPSVTWAELKAGIAESEATRIRALVGEAMAQARSYAFECRLKRAEDGREIIIGARGQPVRGPDGGLSGMVGVVQDVTTRVEARDGLMARDQRLRVATSLARLGIFEWHMLEDEAIWENDRMFEIFGHGPEDGTVGKNEFLNDILHPDDRQAVRRAISTALREDAILHTTGRIRRRSDGAWRTIDMAGRFERDAPNRLPRRLIGVVADVTDRRVAEERQTLLIRELHHRVKNTLATVQAIVGSTARTASSIDSFYEAFVGRIKSLAHTHAVLTEDTWQTASLRNLLLNELKPYAEEDGDGDGAADGRIALDGPEIDLPSEIAVPIGMAIHELTTNAAKYGALSNRSGRVAVAWAMLPDSPNGTLRFAWRESGGPTVLPPSRQGFGSRLLQRVLSTQVQAEVETTYAPDGFSLTMLAPLPPRNDALNPLT
ncbi:HWE histidine kinase domain-containing protein [Methylobacterium trifolii]|uniref:HWE histidine kinase domain-containing protein n=1 Tax=Methylobacterium trifolii TaxID=1003092 RepID=UPI001EDDCE8D|nr:HWE histidine kinase domain-containing protein [Methylobacterium trifolii]